MSFEGEYAGLMEALNAPTVGETYEQKLDELADLVARYPAKPRKLLAQRSAPADRRGRTARR
ncbi:hypothetical protein NE235_06865 [Actinoallomurus spadix]|uniref:Uncharacterized protein n=1 Tax=Actinoallomurus spadix TaxID=79912 RepID=A0ABN0VW90_9ACTN|nr:hypothetical protein [Actinoallomurus spadix]MCO5985823.1 hypothetical protein [Actinoallomurus spadix]